MSTLRFRSVSVALAAAAGFALFAAGGLEAQSEGRRIFTDNEAKVLIIRTSYRSLPLSGGSSFIVEYDQRKYLVTNFHVLSAGEIYLEREGRKIEGLEVLRVNDEADIAILTFPGIDDFRSISLSGYEPERGEKVYAMGYPHVPGSKELSLTITDGLVSNNNLEDGLTEQRFIQISAPINSGNSGGPVFGEEGQLIGMATAYIRGKQNMNLAIPSADIRHEIRVARRGPGENANARQAVRDRLDQLAELVKEKRISEYGFYYSPEYKREIYPGVLHKLQRVYYAHGLAMSRQPKSGEEAMETIGGQLKADEMLFYLMLFARYNENNTGNFSAMMQEMSLRPFLAAQLYLSGRFHFLLHKLAGLSGDENLVYASHSVEGVHVHSDGRRADAILAFTLRNGKRYNMNLKLQYEWGNWYVRPSYDYEALLREN